jgi:hypothetical protein
LELPDDDQRGDDLDQRVEAEARQRNRPRGNRRSQHEHRADDVPAERRVLEPQAATAERFSSCQRCDHDHDDGFCA